MDTVTAPTTNDERRRLVARATADARQAAEMPEWRDNETTSAIALVSIATSLAVLADLVLTEREESDE